jgi:hypothetical protein
MKPESSIFKQYTKEQLELIMLYNAVMHQKLQFEQNERHNEAMHEKLMEQTQNAVKAADFHLEGAKTGLRPHRLYHTDVFYSQSEGKFCCRMPIMMEDDDEEGQISPIVAYGDTPAEACDNFDYAWIHGARP